MKILLIFLCCCAFVTYLIYRAEAAPVPPLVSKRVAEKPVPGETDGARGLGNPPFFLVADDGSYVEVGPTAYRRTEAGDWYASREWQKGTAPA